MKNKVAVVRLVFQRAADVWTAIVFLGLFLLFLQTVIIL